MALPTWFYQFSGQQTWHSIVNCVFLGFVGLYFLSICRGNASRLFHTDLPTFVLHFQAHLVVLCHNLLF